MNAGDIASRRNHAANLAADNYRFVSDFWVVALFNGCVKRITINMGDGQIMKFGMFYNARAAAGRAAVCIVFELGQAVATKAKDWVLRDHRTRIDREQLAR